MMLVVKQLGFPPPFLILVVFRGMQSGAIVGSRGGVARKSLLQKDEIGWVMYEMPTAGFRLALPRLATSRLGPKGIRRRSSATMLEKNRHLQTMIGDRHELAVKGVEFRSIDPGTLRDDYATNVNVVRQAVRPEFDLESGTCGGCPASRSQA